MNDIANIMCIEVINNMAKIQQRLWEGAANSCLVLHIVLKWLKNVFSVYFHVAPKCISTSIQTKKLHNKSSHFTNNIYYNNIQ